MFHQKLHHRSRVLSGMNKQNFCYLYKISFRGINNSIVHRSECCDVYCNLTKHNLTTVGKIIDKKLRFDKKNYIFIDLTTVVR